MTYVPTESLGDHCEFCRETSQITDAKGGNKKVEG